MQLHIRVTIFSTNQLEFYIVTRSSSSRLVLMCSLSERCALVVYTICTDIYICTNCIHKYMISCAHHSAFHSCTKIFFLKQGRIYQEEQGWNERNEVGEAPYFCTFHAESGRMLIEEWLSWQFPVFRTSTEVTYHFYIHGLAATFGLSLCRFSSASGGGTTVNISDLPKGGGALGPILA